MATSFDPWREYVVAAEVSMATQAGAGDLAAQRAQRLEALLASAAARSPRYRRVLAGRDPATQRLEDLPIARKAELMRDFEGWVADPALSLQTLRRFVADPANIGKDFLGRYTVWESSGSTGEPAIFVQDAQAMAVYDALEALRRPQLRPLDRWLDPWSLTERIAFVGATDGHFASTVSVERLRRRQPGLAERLVGMSFLQPLSRLCAELDAFGPTVVATYPSAAVLLAQERCAGRLKATPREIWTGGEPRVRAQHIRLSAGQQLRGVGVPVLGLRVHRGGASSQQRLGDPGAGQRAGPCDDAAHQPGQPCAAADPL